MAYYRDAVIDDCAILAPKMRQQDATEVWHSNGMSPLEALYMSYDICGENHTIIDDHGEIIGMFGCGHNEETPNIGVPWLLASDKLPTITREFLPQSKEWIDSLDEKYDMLFNFVHADNKVSIRWLKWMGFKFLRKQYYGVNPSEFYPFVKLKGA